MSTGRGAPPGIPVDPAGVCAALGALAQHELSLVESGAYDELDAVGAVRLDLLTALGAPGSARLTDADKDVLRSAARTQLLAREAMRQARDTLAGQLGRTDHARRAAAGYRASTAI
ncbi:hypothetical protein DSM112329_00039 [Paraconexibacter sp. AEG42_29]|uniref:Flagellar protein FlgN n=1 Tax=Paraconexibacter sp. AEG42_29 TaxID=2997339 RepID=A0AAU7ANZ5_9ACTN